MLCILSLPNLISIQKNKYNHWNNGYFKNLSPLRGKLLLRYFKICYLVSQKQTETEQIHKEGVRE